MEPVEPVLKVIYQSHAYIKDLSLPHFDNRTIMDIDKFDSVKPFYEYLKILPLKNNIKLLQGKFIWKLVNALHPNSVSEKFLQTYNEAINNYQNILAIPYHQSALKRSPAYTAYKLWNK